jgi:predicted CopG family antitoxin
MVPPLIVDENSKLNALKIADITPSGIDFHCSSVLNTVLSNHEVYNQLVKLVGNNSINDLNEEPNGTSKECNKTIPFTVDGKVSKDFILSKLKSCMWNFSSGRNNKSYIVENKMILNEYATTLQEKEIWKLISAHVDSYVVNYVSCRVNLLHG